MRFDVTKRVRLGPHEDRGSHSPMLLHADAAKHGAVANAGRAEDDVSTLREIVRIQDAVEVSSVF